MKDHDPARVDNPFLIEELSEERPGILLWMLEGVHRLLANRYQFTISERSIQNLEAAMADSDNPRQEIIRYFPQFADKIRVVYCGVNTEKFHPVDDPAQLSAVKEKYGIDRDYFLYLGTVEPRKNLERLIEAYDRFCQGKETPPYLVLAGGKGWLDSGIYKKAEELGKDGHCKPRDHEEGPRRCHCPDLPGRSHHHPARYRVAVLRGSAHVPAVLYQHLPQRHFL